MAYQNNLDKYRGLTIRLTKQYFDSFYSILSIVYLSMTMTFRKGNQKIYVIQTLSTIFLFKYAYNSRQLTKDDLGKVK